MTLNTSVAVANTMIDPLSLLWKQYANNLVRYICPDAQKSSTGNRSLLAEWFQSGDISELEFWHPMMYAPPHLWWQQKAIDVEDRFWLEMGKMRVGGCGRIASCKEELKWHVVMKTELDCVGTKVGMIKRTFLVYDMIVSIYPGATERYNL